MTTRRTTTPTERIDMLIQQVERFLELDLVGEGTARARAALAQCMKEMRDSGDEHVRSEIATRRAYVEQLLGKLVGRPGLPSEEHSTI